MNYFNPYQQGMFGGQPLQAQPQIQSGGIITVRSEDEARRYPVAPGNSVTFKIEGQSVIIEKTMGFSQFDAPRIEKYRLVKEAQNEPISEGNDAETYKYPTDEIKTEIEAIWGEIEAIKGRLKPAKKKKELA